MPSPSARTTTSLANLVENKCSASKSEGVTEFGKRYLQPTIDVGIRDWDATIASISFDYQVIPYIEANLK